MSRLAMDVVASQTDYSKDPKFTEAVAKKVYYGPVYFRRESEPYMTLSLAGTRRDAGVSVAEVNLKLIWDVVSQIKVGERGQAYVIDAQGRLIAHPDISLVLRNTDMTRLAQVQGGARGRRPASQQEPVQEAEDIQGRKVLTAYAPVTAPGWLVFVELPSEEAYAPLSNRSSARACCCCSAWRSRCSPACSWRAGWWCRSRRCARAPRASARGDLGQRISIKTGDELESARRPVQRHGRQAAGVLCRPGEEGRGPHPRAVRVAGAADRDLRGAAASSPARRANCSRCSTAMLENATRICEAQVRRPVPAARATTFACGRDARRRRRPAPNVGSASR